MKFLKKGAGYSSKAAKSSHVIIPNLDGCPEKMCRFNMQIWFSSDFLGAHSRVGWAITIYFDASGFEARLGVDFIKKNEAVTGIMKERFTQKRVYGPANTTGGRP